MSWTPYLKENLLNLIFCYMGHNKVKGETQVFLNLRQEEKKIKKRRRRMRLHTTISSTQYRKLTLLVICLYSFS